MSNYHFIYERCEQKLTQHSCCSGSKSDSNFRSPEAVSQSAATIAFANQAPSTFRGPAVSIAHLSDACCATFAISLSAAPLKSRGGCLAPL